MRIEKPDSIDTGRSDPAKRTERRFRSVWRPAFGFDRGPVSEGTDTIISVKKAFPLLGNLNRMAPVEQATKKGNKIQKM